jgi:hypothetical protein
MDLTVPPDGAFVGTWDGRIDAGPSRIAFRVTVRQNGGKLEATIDIPEQGLVAEPLEHVLHHGKAVHFELDVPGARAVVEATLEGDRAEGTLKQGGGAYPLHLWRAGTPPP